jgi:hypothetical protein
MVTATVIMMLLMMMMMLIMMMRSNPYPNSIRDHPSLPPTPSPPPTRYIPTPRRSWERPRCLAAVTKDPR